MANYNTFVVVDCKTRKSFLTTSSARKASAELRAGVRIEVWNGNSKVETIYNADRKRERGNPMAPYISAEKQYIRRKQELATQRNARRKKKRGEIEWRTNKTLKTAKRHNLQAAM